MTTYHYERFSHTVKRRVPCLICGRKVSRQRTFSQTDSPFNKNADGTRKTIPEIRQSLYAEGHAWDPIATCAHCEETS